MNWPDQTRPNQSKKQKIDWTLVKKKSIIYYFDMFAHLYICSVLTEDAREKKQFQQSRERKLVGVWA